MTGIFAVNIFTELRNCCKMGSHRRQCDSFTRSIGGTEYHSRVQSKTNVPAVKNISTTSNGKLFKINTERTTDNCVQRGTFEGPSRDQQNHSDCNTGLAICTSNHLINTDCGNYNQNNNENVLHEAVEKLNADSVRKNVNGMVDLSMGDSDSENETEHSPMLGILSYIVHLPLTQLETHNVSPSMDLHNSPLMPSVVMPVRQAHMPSSDNQQAVLCPLLVECDSDSSTEL